jgi:hypothetical protein
VAADVRRVWRALERFAEGPRAAPALIVAALGVYALVSLALPLAAGRDLARYLLVYAQLFDAEVVYPHAVLTRTPVAPLVTGGLLDAGPVVAEVGAALLYALSVLAWCSVARRFGPAAALATAAALLLYPGYVLLFHQLSSDTVFAAGFALFAVLAARMLDQATPGRAAALGASVSLLVLIRPVAQGLLLLVLLRSSRSVPGVAASARPRRSCSRRASRSSAGRCTTRYGSTTSRSPVGEAPPSRCSARSWQTGSWNPRTAPRRAPSRAPWRATSSRTSPTARTGSTSRASSPPGAAACTTT